MIYVLMNPKANNGLGEVNAREWASRNIKEEYPNVEELSDWYKMSGHHLKKFFLLLQNRNII